MPRIRVHDRLWFDDIGGCAAASDTTFAYVHACKDPCHRRAVGNAGNLMNCHPDHFAYQNGCHLYLNLIDPPGPDFAPESFAAFFTFVDAQIADRPVLIHCNRGESRAPSLALLYAAKRLHIFPDTTYAQARAAFAQKHPYRPGSGIAAYLEREWDRLGV